VLADFAKDVPGKEHLQPEDYTTLLDLLPDIYRLQDLGNLASGMLQHLVRLIPAPAATYNELDLKTGQTVVVTWPRERHDDMIAGAVAASPAVMQHPLFSHYLNAENPDILAISDLVPHTAWRENPFYKAMLPFIGIEDTMYVPLMMSEDRWIFIGFNRFTRSFSPREHALAGLLRPHLATAYANARAFTEAKAFSLIAGMSLDNATVGLVLLDGRHRVIHMNPRAAALCARYYDDGQAARFDLPEEIASWLGRLGTTANYEVFPLLHKRQDGVVLECRAALVESGGQRILLLREKSLAGERRRFDGAGLTDREGEVLYWLCEGKYNPEIAQILAVSRRTVDKHLEHIYAKLGVGNRAAALRTAAQRFNALSPGI